MLVSNQFRICILAEYSSLRSVNMSEIPKNISFVIKLKKGIRNRHQAPAFIQRHDPQKVLNECFLTTLRKECSNTFCKCG